MLYGEATLHRVDRHHAIRGTGGNLVLVDGFGFWHANADVDQHRLTWEAQRWRHGERVTMQRILHRTTCGLGAIFTAKIGAHTDFDRHLGLGHAEAPSKF